MAAKFISAGIVDAEKWEILLALADKIAELTSDDEGKVLTVVADGSVDFDDLPGDDNVGY